MTRNSDRAPSGNVIGMVTRATDLAPIKDYVSALSREERGFRISSFVKEHDPLHFLIRV